MPIAPRVVRGRDRPEALLTRCIPLHKSPRDILAPAHHRPTGIRGGGRGTHNLQLDALAVELNRADLEVNADGG